MAALKNRVAQLEEELRETEREKSRVSEQSGRLTSENQLLRDQHSKQVREKSCLNEKSGPLHSKTHHSKPTFTGDSLTHSSNIIQ